MKTSIKNFMKIFLSIFTIMILFGIFITGDINIFKWNEFGRVMIIVSSSILSLITLMFQELKEKDEL